MMRRVEYNMVFLPNCYSSGRASCGPLRGTCLDGGQLVGLTCYYAGRDTQESIRLSANPRPPGPRRHGAARAGRDPRRDRAARAAARHRDRQGGAVRAARRLALSGVRGARAPRRRGLRRGAAAARHARRPHQHGRLPRGDVHPPRARRPRRCARSRRAPMRRCSRRSTGICASRRPCSPTRTACRFHELDLELHEVLLGFPRLRAGEERGRDRARQPRPRAAVHVHAGSARLRPCASTRRSSRRSSATTPTPPPRAMEAHLDAVMTELVDFAGRHPDAVDEPRETAAA